MNTDNDVFGSLFIIIILVLMGFIVGFFAGVPKYKISSELKTKLEHDAKKNYRTYDEQISFIINKNYGEIEKL